MKKKYSLAVYIGRFQPVHKGHIFIVEETLKNVADKILIVIGSSRSPRTPKNPWTAEERAVMFYGSLSNTDNIHWVGVPDFIYDESQWIRAIGNAVADKIKTKNIDTSNGIVLVGHDKDHSSYYLDYFPQWNYKEYPPYPPVGESIDSTKIRDLMFRGDYEFIRSVVSPWVFQWIMDFTKTVKFNHLKREWDFIHAYKKLWSSAPYPPTFVTVDAVVVQSGHVLLVKRGEHPGKGMWAMPGGFIGINERIEDSVIRELCEETRLKVPEKVLRGSIKHREVFDAPDRSPRGRTITHAYLFHLDDSMELPRVKGSDDAEEAKWIPLSDFEHMEPMMNEDHWHIINHMLNQL